MRNDYEIERDDLSRREVLETADIRRLCRRTRCTGAPGLSSAAHLERTGRATSASSCAYRSTRVWPNPSLQRTSRYTTSRTLKLSSFVADRYADFGHRSGFESPAFEGLDSEFVEHRAAGALGHSRVGDSPCRDFNAHNTNAVSGEVAAFRFVRIFGQRRTDCHGLGN